MNRYFAILLTCLLLTGCVDNSMHQKETVQLDRQWWKEGIIYQIYPRSFKDTDGDSIGDLRGVIEELDYIASLGVTMVWMNPFFQSPNADNDS